ncbi:MAG: hypothetical protein ABFS32_14975, partial [Bacteroidota bacterium]
MKTKSYTLLAAVFLTAASAFAQDWVYLQSGPSAGSSTVFGPWAGGDGTWATADDDIHVWDGENTEREVIITDLSEADGAKKYFTISVSAMWTGTTQNFTIDINEDGAPRNQPVEAAPFTGTATESQKWYAKLENGHYVIFNKVTNQVFAAGAGNGTDIELLDYYAADAKQHWTYFKQNPVGFDPFDGLAEVIACTFDGGIISSRGDGIDWAINVTPTELRPSVVPCNPTGTINYTWEYSNDGTTYTALPDDGDGVDDSYVFTYKLDALGAAVGSSIFFKRIATDDIGSFDSNIIEFPVVAAVDWVKLAPKSAVTVHEGDGVQALDVYDADKNPSNFDVVHLWAHRFGNEGQQMMILPTDETNYFAIQAMNLYGSTFVFDGWDPECKIWDGGGTPNDEKKWYVTREGDDKQYVIHVKSTWQNGERALNATSDDLGADVNTIALDVNSEGQQWSYLELSKPNYDPLAAFIQGDLDEGIIDNGGQTSVAYSEIPAQFNSKLDAGGGDNNITYQWEYSVDNVTFFPIGENPEDVGDVNRNYYGFYYALGPVLESLGLTLQANAYARRAATDGLGATVYSNVITLNVEAAPVSWEIYAEDFETADDIANWSHLGDGANVYTTETHNPTGGVDGGGALELGDAGYAMLAMHAITATVGYRYELSMDVKTQDWDDQATYPIFVTIDSLDADPD